MCVITDLSVFACSPQWTQEHIHCQDAHKHPQSRPSQTHTNLATLFLLVILIFSCFSVSISSLKPFKTKRESKWPQSVSFHYAFWRAHSGTPWKLETSAQHLVCMCVHESSVCESNIYLGAQNAFILFMYTHNRKTYLCKLVLSIKLKVLEFMIFYDSSDWNGITSTKNKTFVHLNRQDLCAD